MSAESVTSAGMRGCVLEIEFVDLVFLALTGVLACILYGGCARQRATFQTQASFNDIFNTVVQNTVDKGSMIPVSA
jgi:hypothetical protein